MIDITPIGNQILVQRLRRIKEPKIVTDAGLEIPNQVTEQLQLPLSRVLKVGPGRTLESGATVPPPVEAGDIVLLTGDPTMVPVEADDRMLGICDASCVVAIVNGIKLSEYQDGVSLTSVKTRVAADIARAEAAQGVGRVALAKGFRPS